MRIVKVNELKGYEGFDGYTIDEEGNVYSYYVVGTNRKYGGLDYNKPPKKIKPAIKSNGYKHLGISDVDGKTKYPTIHRLLALAFIENPDDLPFVNHKNGNKLDNSLDNLEWIDRNGNARHALEAGLFNRFSNNMYKPVNQYDLDGNFIKTHACIADAARSLGFETSSKSAISRVCNGKQKTSGGFTWKYVEK